MSNKQKGQGMLYVKPGSKKGLVFPSFFNFVIFLAFFEHCFDYLRHVLKIKTKQTKPATIEDCFNQYSLSLKWHSQTVYSLDGCLWPFYFSFFSSYFCPVLRHNSIDFVGSVALIWQNIMHNSEMKILEVNII